MAATGINRCGWSSRTTLGISPAQPRLATTFCWNTTPPTGTLVINGNATATNNAHVNLTLSATDAISGVSQMRFANYGQSWSTWEPFVTSKTWTLDANGGDGDKSVWVELKITLEISPGRLQSATISPWIPLLLTATYRSTMVRSTPTLPALT